MATQKRTRFVKIPLHAAYAHPDLPRPIPAGTLLDALVTEVATQGPAGTQWKIADRQAAVPDDYLPAGKPAMRIRI